MAVLRSVTEQEKIMAMMIKVKGMTCGHCAESTRKALEGVDGISNVRVDLESGEVIFDGAADMNVIKTAVAKAGYEVVD